MALIQTQQPLDTLPGFADRLQSSLAQLFSQTLPALIGALVILFAGYLLAKVLERLVERALRRIRLNSMLERGGVDFKQVELDEGAQHLESRARVLANC